MGAKQPRQSCLSLWTRGQGMPELWQLLYSECLFVLVLHETLRTVCHKAALAGNLNLPMYYDELSVLSPVVCREVLTRVLSRCIKDVPGISVVDTNMDNIVEVLLGPWAVFIPSGQWDPGLHQTCQAGSEHQRCHLCYDLRDPTFSRLPLSRCFT